MIEAHYVGLIDTAPDSLLERLETSPHLRTETARLSITLDPFKNPFHVVNDTKAWVLSKLLSDISLCASYEARAR